MKRRGKDGYMFDGYYDVFLYLFLSAVCPVISFYVQIQQLDSQSTLSCYSALTTGGLVAATIYYDFYSRMKDTKNKSSCTKKAVFWGRNLFAGITVFIGIVLFALKEKGAVINANGVKIGMYILIIVCLYPTVICVVEIIRRLHSEYTKMFTKTGA